VLLETNCPNNTLPDFWKEGRFGGRHGNLYFLELPENEIEIAAG
jgi:hypothetical protein